MKKEQNKTNQETKKNELLHVVITDAKTGETLVDEKSTLFAGVIGQEKGSKTVIIGGGNLNEYYNVALRLTEASKTITKAFFSEIMKSKEGE